MSTPNPIDQLQPPSTPYHGRAASVGPVIAVLTVITILGVIAGMIGRLCSGRPIFGYGHYDVEGWVERKCSSCLDGSLDLRRPPPREVIPVAVAVAVPVTQPPEVKESEQKGDRDNNSHSTTAVSGNGAHS